MLNPVLCVFLLSCFTDTLPRTRFPDCPDKCDCYSAPKSMYSINIRHGNELKSSHTQPDGLSLVCTTFPAINQLNKLSKHSITTLALKNLNIADLSAIATQSSNFLPEFSITNIVFSHSLLSDAALSGFLNINKPALRVLTFIAIDFTSLSNVWNIFSAFANLQALHVENSTLATLDANFARLLSENIFVANFIDIKLQHIADNVFRRWTKLRTLTITQNSIKDTYWLRSQLPQLWYLDLRRNEISSLRTDLMTQLPNLKVLKLDNNKLMIIGWQTMRPLVESLRELSFEGNHVCLNQEMWWTVEDYKPMDKVPPDPYKVLQDPLFYTWTLYHFSCVGHLSGGRFFNISVNCMQHNYEQFRSYTGDCSNYEANCMNDCA